MLQVKKLINICFTSKRKTISIDFCKVQNQLVYAQKKCANSFLLKPDWLYKYIQNEITIRTVVP